MAKSSVIQQFGEVTQELGSGNFKVLLENQITILCRLSGKLVQNYIKVMAGDRVEVEMSPYDLTRGRISKRLTKSNFNSTAQSKNKGKKK